jgi:DNA-binding NarL/FixJ family response regulator
VIGRCSSAEDAFAYVSSLRPDPVLVDATLGLGGCANLVTRMLEVCPEARVIVLGDDQDADLLLATIHSGAAGVVGKTYGADTVLRVAGAVLEGEGAVPRGMLLELTRRTVSLDRTPDSPLACLFRASARCSPAQPRLGQRPDRAGAVHQPAHRAYSHPEHPGKLEMHSRLDAATSLCSSQCSSS